MSATERGYTVLRGDTLSGIAAKHGISSWKSLYEAPANAAFRRKRPNPNLMHPGDRIVIPPDALAAAKQRLKTLEAIKHEFEQSHQKPLRQLDADFRDVRKVAMTVDTVATVSSMLANVRRVVAAGEFLEKAGRMSEHGTMAQRAPERRAM